MANVAEGGFENNPSLEAVRERAATEAADVVPVCAAIEAEIAQLDEGDRLVFLEELGLHEPGLDRVIRAAYHLLGLLTFFTAGVKEVRAWTTHLGALAPQAAGEIHTDFEKGFIRAEVIAYGDFIACKGEQGAKEAGKMRLEGKETSSAKATSCTSASTSSRARSPRQPGFQPGMSCRAWKGRHARARTYRIARHGCRATGRR